ncbi:chemotaxis protein [Marinisporobacter balticus]|uniref:Stage 0 sporulation protein A homolog n=1 Tax=Marinisporobacter balticus TaxID=2018667 RepID=A0A4R2K8N9_9FIRM|nr:chemotaxis protein [Marinisporobacter balticus]TCO68994.1 two-component system chemotaxis response regulator CheV [Marinisporobacter balticus]
MKDQAGILLESGTGEVEVLEFVVANKHYAINVIKTKEIFQVDNITKLPNISAAIAGMTLVRGKTITLIDLKYVLEKEKGLSNEKNRALLCEFNKTEVAFVVDRVIGIHRIGWNQIEKPDEIVSDSLVIGNIVMDGKILMLLDFEKIFMDMRSSYGGYEEGIEKIEYNKARSAVRLLLADDSTTIRTMLKDVLTESGYTNLTFFNDGEETFNYLRNQTKEKGKEIFKYVDALITDIEMPQMDGHTLTRKIKEDPILRDLPVIIFSSLITDDLHHKGESVGAEAQMSKPDIDQLVDLIDKYTLKKK